MLRRGSPFAPKQLEVPVRTRFQHVKHPLTLMTCAWLIACESAPILATRDGGEPEGGTRQPDGALAASAPNKADAGEERDGGTPP